MKIVWGVLLMFCINMMCIKSVRANNENTVDNKYIFFTIDGANVEYLLDETKPAGRQPITKTATFSLKEKTINICFRWFNPLMYQINWKDTSYVDKRNEAVQDFIDQLASYYGIEVASIDHSGEPNGMFEYQSRDSKSTDHINIGVYTFKDIQMAQFYIDILTMATLGSNIITQDDLKILDQILEMATELEQLYTRDYPSILGVSLKNLYSVQDENRVQSTVEIARKSLDTYNIEFDRIVRKNAAIEDLIDLNKPKGISGLSQTWFKNYAISTISNFIKKSKTNIALNKKLASKLEMCCQLLDSSIMGKIQTINDENYYIVRRLSLEEGKTSETTISIKNLKFDPATTEVTSETVNTSKLIFQQFKSTTFTVSSGICFASTEIKGFGVKIDTNGQFRVTDDDVKEGQPLAAVFLNWHILGDPSDPATDAGFLIQFGLDPTKKRPFFLLGGGFFLSGITNRIRISAGPLFSWKPTLDKYALGDVVESTSALEKDITYKLEKLGYIGWYLGVQYTLSSL